MGIIRYINSDIHAPECECQDCVEVRGIERRAKEYRNQTRSQPKSKSEIFYLDQSYDMVDIQLIKDITPEYE